MASQDQRQTDRSDEEQRRESGAPGGGVGRREDVRGSGVYPASGPLPEGDAPYHGEASWGQGERGAEGYEDHGDSEAIPIPVDADMKDEGTSTGEGAEPWRK